ncbi:LamG domain-containing protein [Halorubrum sp. AJ67]|uniref:LamG domain-containing protein n=1 Tax=Halorubrum sp. AJ67 TaxID=1173487 RepID=UPI0003DCBBF0|nr:LamG domain-containing protein [Halorubrum sp. AJ67]CDK38274.1 concanavalin A-like lectin/glucanases family protein [Halorubrum sp. AJ67]
MPGESHRFTTNRRLKSNTKELGWGGDRDWQPDIEENDEIEINSGSVFPWAGPNIPTEGLVSYWDLNAGSGNSITDIEGSHNGSIHNATWTTDSERDGSVLQFDGGNDYIVLNGWSGITGTHPRTWAIWFKSGSSRDHRLISYGANTYGNKYDIRIDDANGDVLRVENANGQKYGSVDVIDGQWHLLTVVFPSGGSAVHDHSLYVDATLDSNTGGGNQSLNTATSTNVFFGKSHWHADDTKGRIGAVYAYDRELSQSAIQTLYDETK